MNMRWRVDGVKNYTELTKLERRPNVVKVKFVNIAAANRRRVFAPAVALSSGLDDLMTPICWASIVKR